MWLTPVFVSAETTAGSAPAGLFRSGDAAKALEDWKAEYAGKAQVVYIDPPFCSGQVFHMRSAVGAKEWKTQSASLDLEAYRDQADPLEAEAFLRGLIEGCRELLSDTGLLFLHVDWRLSGRARRLLDEIFGEGNIVNEIIWSYQTGGRAKRYFSRKHDAIFLYRKGPEYFFDIEAVPISREGARRNHMKRQVDADGRVYRTIRSGGKIYTYYDDEPVYPGDVWDDIHMQQKDPQRTGYDTQKPLKLLERIILCSTRPGDLVVDPCAGSGTALEAAWRNGRRFLGADMSDASLLAVRRRLGEAAVRYESEGGSQGPMIEARLTGGGIGDWELRLINVEGEPVKGKTGFDGIDGWAFGYLRGGEFVCCASEQRSRACPELAFALRTPVYEGAPAVRVSDVFGKTYYYSVDKDKVEYEK